MPQQRSQGKEQEGAEAQPPEIGSERYRFLVLEFLGFQARPVLYRAPKCRDKLGCSFGYIFVIQESSEGKAQGFLPFAFADSIFVVAFMPCATFQTADAVLDRAESQRLFKAGEPVFEVADTVARFNFDVFILWLWWLSAHMVPLGRYEKRPSRVSTTMFTRRNNST